MHAAPHGTVASYQKGCRCDRCRAGWATYIRERRHRLGIQTPREDARFYEGPYESAGEVKLTELGLARLDALVEKTGKKKHDVIEQLLREHSVCFEACGT